MRRFKQVFVERKVRKVMPQGQYGRIVKSPYEEKGKKKIHTYFEFKDWKKAEKFIARMGVDDTPAADFVDGQTGEVLMQPGMTKRAQLKKSGKADHARKYDDAMSGPWLYSYGEHERGQWDDEWRFNDFYNVIERKMMDVVDEPEKLLGADYDIYGNYPSKIKRKDGRPFTEYDVDNIRYYLNFWAFTSGGGNIKLWPSEPQKGARVGSFEPMFT